MPINIINSEEHASAHLTSLKLGCVLKSMVSYDSCQPGKQPGSPGEAVCLAVTSEALPTWHDLNFLLDFSRTFVVVFQSLMSISLWLHGLQHARLPYPSLSPGVCSNSCSLSWWCHQTISSYITPFSSWSLSLPNFFLRYFDRTYILLPSTCSWTFGWPLKFHCVL